MQAWVTVKAATLIFISGRGLAISSALEEGLNSGFIYNLANVRAFHVNPDPIFTELTFIITLKAPITPKVICFCHLLKCFEASLTNSVDPDQTAPVRSGSTLFASILSLTNKKTFSDADILLAF